ncbi:hypothetical protein GOP47_0030067 [Adiantum capillus-veneris]|nr:hypothetical protein GOP47_0030067 [Adiantum capillus-veneris]
MQNSHPLHGRSSSLSSQAASKDFRESSTCLPCSAQSSFPASGSIRFWQGFRGLSSKQFTKLSKERREKRQESKQALEEFYEIKKETSSCNEDSVQFWSCTKSTLIQRTSIRNQRDFSARDFFLVSSAPSSHIESFQKVLRSFIWQIQCSNVEICGRLAVLSIFSSLLVCCPPLCLNEAPASAHEIFQKEATFVMDSSARNLAQDLSLVTKATPLFSLSDNASVCEEAYGVFPCSNSLPGNLFLMLVYGYLLLLAARFISEGSELLLEVMNPGLIGGLVLPVLGALPDAALICASGVGGTVEEAQQEVLVGVGVLAGSTTLILSVVWAGSLVAGRCDLSGPGHTAKDLTLTHGFDLFRTGITTDEQTRWGALIMIASGAPYICAQLPLLDKHPEQGPESALAGCILALSGLVLYSGYQIASPWLQKKKIEEARLQYLRTSALQGISAFSENLMVPSALSFQEQAIARSDPILQEIFASFDKNADGKIERDELRGLILGLNIDKGSFQDKEQVEIWFKEFDVNTDGMLSEAEFLVGIRNWANRVAKQRKTFKFQQIKNSMLRIAPNFWGAKLEEAKQALDLLEAELEQDDKVSSDKDEENGVLNASKIYQKSLIYLVSGAALAATFSDPLIDSIQGFSNASRIPPFFVAFVVVPLASNASELFSSIVFAMKKRKRNISLTYSQIYGSVTMNNTLCLGIFLGIVYARGLTWDFSSEVTVVLLNILLVGLIGASRVTFPLWYAIPVFSLYFLSLGGVALLDNLLGWQ